VQAPPESSDVRTLVSCGTTWLGQRVLIVDPETLCSCHPGEIGEIWIAGPSVAQGYWGQEEASQETFQAFTSDTCDGPFLRTGDLGFLKDGELFVTGRRKDLLIIHGKNYYPQDIEVTVEKCHSAIRFGCSAVFSVPVDGGEGLVVVAEVERAFQRGYDSPQASTSNQHVRREPESASSADEVKALYLQNVVSTIRKTVATEHDLPLHAVVLLKPATIPKTSSGKVQRHLCRSGYQTRLLAGLHWDEPSNT
jgi:acyl-CoA synthetase (AMP-forming)/AMP-acid ligase II